MKTITTIKGVNEMTLKDIIKDANEVLGLTIDWDNFATDENYRQLFRCACLVLNTITGEYQFNNNDNIGVQIKIGDISVSTVIYGILTEYSFIAGMLNEWKVWKQKYGDGLFNANNGETKTLPRSFNG
jgi:hypothetical protein